MTLGTTVSESSHTVVYCGPLEGTGDYFDMGHSAQ